MFNFFWRTARHTDAVWRAPPHPAHRSTSTIKDINAGANDTRDLAEQVSLLKERLNIRPKDTSYDDEICFALSSANNDIDEAYNNFCMWSFIVSSFLFFPSFFPSFLLFLPPSPFLPSLNSVHPTAIFPAPNPPTVTTITTTLHSQSHTVHHTTAHSPPPDDKFEALRKSRAPRAAGEHGERRGNGAKTARKGDQRQEPRHPKKQGGVRIERSGAKSDAVSIRRPSV